MPDDRQQMEAGAPRPVAEGAAVEIKPLAPEDIGLAVEWQMVAELRDHDPRNELLGRQPARHDMFGCMRLRHALRAAPAGILRAACDQHPELGGDHIQPFGDVFADPGHLAAATGAERAGGLDHPLDAGQMRRQMSAVTPGLAGGIRAPGGP